MKISKLREFRPGNDPEKYLLTDLAFSLRDLFTALTRLTFGDNFNSFTATITVAASGDTAIRNEIGVIPSGKIIIKDGGSSDIVDGDTAWTTDYVYLKNLGGSPVTVTVVFFE